MKTTSRFRRLFAAAPVAVSLLLAPALKATPLLTAAYEAQLEAWLGQGDLTFTNVFTKTTGSTAVDFHAAADGKGATFTLLSIGGAGDVGLFALPDQIIGGYNPQSWSSIDGPSSTPGDSDRTAFIYNLTSGTIQRQNLTGEGEGPSSGQAQTWNGSYYGPTFGGGWDLYSDYYFLNQGWAFNYSYGGTSYGDEIVTGGPNYSAGDYAQSRFNIYALEVYTFTPVTTTVPDTAGSLGLLSGSLFALAILRRRIA